MKHLGVMFLLGGGGLLVVATLLLPVLYVVAEGGDSSAKFEMLSDRQSGLLLRGFRVAAEAAILAQIIGTGLAIGMERRAAGWNSAATWWLAVGTLLTPTYIHAYAWSLLVLPAGVATSRMLAGPVQEWFLTEGRAVWCLATWLSPVAAMILLAGWRNAGRYVFQLARLDAGAAVSLRTSSYVMAAWVIVSLLTCFVVAITEYAVCHLSLCLTWNTEILAQMQDQMAPGGVLRLAWPLVAVVLACLILSGVLFVWLRRCRGMLERELHTDAALESSRASRFAVLIWAASVLILLAPIGVLAASLQSMDGFAQLPALYANHARWSAVIAIGAVVATFWISLSLLFVWLCGVARPCGATRSRSSVRAGLMLTLALIVIAQLAMAVSPPALVGDAFAAAYENIAWVRDHWGILSLVCTARFGIVTTLALWIATPRQLGDMARCDGATLWDEMWRVRLPGAWRQIAASMLIVFVLSYQEIAATLLVVPPNVGNLPKTLLNAIHFGRNDAVIAMSLSLVFVSACLSALIIRLLRRSNRA